MSGGIMRKRILLPLGLFVLAQGIPFDLTHAQYAEPMRITDVTPISTGGSLVTIQTPLKIDFPRIDTRHIADVQVRNAVRNVALPPDTRVIEMKTIGDTGRSQFLIRESSEVWRDASPYIQPIVQPPTRPPVLWLTTAGSDKGYKLLTQVVPPDSGQNSWGWPEVGPFAIHSAKDTASLTTLFEYNPRLIIINHHGQLLPREWFQFIKNSGRRYVIVTPASPNQDFLAAKSAAELGDHSLRPDRTHILSALPLLDGWFPRLELYRMGFDSDKERYWNDLISRLKAQPLPVSTETATKDSIRIELESGNSDFVFVIAHNDGQYVYLPGMWGGKISFDDFRGMRRESAPNRTIVLITCKGGSPSASERQLADIFIENKLARSVFASEDVVDAVNLPSLLKELIGSNRRIRDILQKYKYTQFVFRSLRRVPNA
jgi:hypothetical protein